MGLFDGLLGNVVGSVLRGGGQNSGLASVLGGLAGGQGGQGAGPLLAAAMSLIQQNGGLENVIAKFGQNGMASHAASWVSTGPNQAISPDQLSQVFGPNALGGIAQQLGLSHGQTSGAMAQLLPELINHLTPQGSVPANHADLLSQGLSMLRGGR